MYTIRRDIVLSVAKALFISSFKQNEDGSAAVANPQSCIDAAEIWATAQIDYCKGVKSESEECSDHKCENLYR